MPPFKRISAPLTPMQKRFVREYLFDLNQTHAAIRAGYSIRTAKVTGAKLMNDPRIEDAVKEAQEDLADSTGITPERIIQEYSKIAFSSIKDYVYKDEEGSLCIDIDKLSDDQAAALDFTIETVKGKRTTERRVKLKPISKTDALTMLAKYLGMFKEQVEHSGSVSLEQLVNESLKTKQEADDA